ncbi:serine protease inhibitor I/II-like [Phymastichus coffea]|uniref:serine protease inhibitor I/II-like n=1 Tax=Phymastichus coffea TaxID=108790 RepID=UPI00273C925D|nr:serine protease inhibitor I/II-like [Phymastichus coffea]
MFAFGFITVAILAVSASAQIESLNNVVTVYGYRPGQKCPANIFFDDCNQCNCPDGYQGACSRMGCSRDKPGTVFYKPLYAPCYKVNDKCPAKHFFDGCNHCVCNGDGISAACTKKFCFTNDDQKCEMPAH